MTAPLRTIMVVDDEVSILRFLHASLEEAGFAVIEASSGRRALDLAASGKPDVILLDLGLPDMDGLDVLKSLREWTSAPVIVLSVRGDESDKIEGLDRGADDYLTKPFGIEELLARIRVALRHKEMIREDPLPIYQHGDLRIDLMARRVWIGKKEVRLSPLQYALLAVLVRNAGRVVSQRQLLEEIWPDGESNSEALRILVHQTRHRIEREPVRPRHLKTEPAVGYRLESSDSQS
ncbi:MAG TPA: DNA-binding response regulator [Elusimicrobia bacterium]|nr:DNA-binding response regulator [Elusimicrobiota bacterium]HBT62886.1 DNA-binding response regulator [Elusimicrobiota bacterium]